MQIRRRSFEQDLYEDARFSGRPSVRELVLLGRQIGELRRAKLQSFLQFLNELHALFQRGAEISGEIYAMEASIELTKDDPPSERIWYFEELIRLEAQMRDLNRELLQKQEQCRAMRSNPPF